MRVLIMDGKNTLEGLYTPTVLQSAMGNPLRSEQRAGELLPRVLSPLDMLVIFIAIVIFVPNASIVQATQGAGLTTYLYWVIGTVTFLLPGAIVVEQLSRFMPVDGSIYVWTHRVLGPLWGFLAGFCAWFPGILVLLAASDTIISLIQGIYTLLWGREPGWLMAPWEQGVFVLIVLRLTGWLATLSLSVLMKWAKGIIALYGVALLMIGLAGVVWLLKGNAPQVPLTVSTGGIGGQNFVLYGVIVLALLGVEVPLNMTAETRRSGAIKLFLRWGPWITLVAYLFGTFGVMMVVPQTISASSFSTLIAINIVFGAPYAD